MSDTFENKLAELIDVLPAQNTVLSNIISLTISENSSAGELGDAIQLDPVFYTRIMRLANSAYYGLSGRVNSTNYAVALLGFTTIRSLALTSAVLSTNTDTGFWKHAAVAALTASELAPVHKLRAQDMFSAGLLSSLGEQLVKELDADLHARIVSGVTSRNEQTQRESQELGTTFLELTARILKIWSLPDILSNTLHYAADSRSSSPSARVLQAAIAVADAATGTFTPDFNSISSGMLSQQQINDFVQLTASSAEELYSSLS